MAINGINGYNALSSVNSLGNTIDKAVKVENEDIAVSFANYLRDAMNKTNDLQVESAQIADDFAAGKTDNIHQVMIAAEKADIALQFTMQIRNKILDAYSEIMRMQI